MQPVKAEPGQNVYDFFDGIWMICRALDVGIWINFNDTILRIHKDLNVKSHIHRWESLRRSEQNNE